MPVKSLILFLKYGKAGIWPIVRGGGCGRKGWQTKIMLGIKKKHFMYGLLPPKLNFCTSLLQGGLSFPGEFDFAKVLVVFI